MAAGGGALVAGQRRAVGRARSAPDPYSGLPIGEARGTAAEVVADDGVRLAADVDGDPEAPLTVVFAHGYTLSLACWEFQRRDLRDEARLVFYDQRSHGASGRSSLEHSTIDQLGADLERVLDQLAPTGPVVLVGHSMGGMTILALADRRPDLFGERVVGVGLLSTSAGKLAEGLFGLPAWTTRGVHAVMPRVARTAHRRARIVERTRRAGSPASYLATRWLSYGPDVPASLVDFMEAMIAATPVEVMAEFFDTFVDHDKLAALPTLATVPTLVVCGDLDVLTPLHHSETMAAELPEGELLTLPGAGHMAIIDRHEEVDAALRRLLDRARKRAGLPPVRRTAAAAASAPAAAGAGPPPSR
jgi:pimeloyl-ACP methyl ester carboxylesterase